MPHQLFEAHLEAPRGTVFVLVEHDLMFRQYAFHTQKLVLHRASMRRFATRLRAAGHDVEVIETDADTTSRAALAQVLARLEPTRLSVYDVVDDWLLRDLVATAADVGYELGGPDVLETPNFLTTREQILGHFTGGSGGSSSRTPTKTSARMATFYAWQRRRLDVLVEADGSPVGGKWSFDEDNRRKLPKGHPVPRTPAPERPPEVSEAIAWVREAFPDNPGNAEAFAWPTSHAEAEASYEVFLAERFEQFGPFEDAISTAHGVVFHSVLTPGLNIGLISPQHVLARALEVGAETDVPLASVEGFVRQVIGWREYMRATYHLWGARMRSGNRLGHTRALAPGWWDATTGLDPVDHVLRRVLETGYAHHIERLMVFGNATCLLRTDPDAVYEWFMEMFIDAYDWVMVPNVYAMSQFAAGAAITTKPYVSGSNYLRKQSDLAKGEWTQDWDALYWTFVRDHQDVFATNPRSRMISNLYDRMAPDTKAEHIRRAGTWLT